MIEPEDIIREWLAANPQHIQEYLPGEDDNEDWIPEEVYEELDDDLEI